MMPSEFLNCTYRELFCFVEANKAYHEQQYKENIILFDALGNKIIDVIGRKKPKGISLVKDNFKELFKEELDTTSKQQTIEEQVQNLRSRM